MSSREKELHAIAYALQAYRKNFQCQGCGWKVRVMRCPPRCPICGSEVKEVYEMENQKLAESVGWHWERYEVASGVFSRVLLAPDERLEEGHIGYIPDHTPNFTESLDACLKWLAPPIEDKGLTLDYVSFRQASGRYYAEWKIYKEKDQIKCGELLAKDYQEGMNLEKITALALCLAIEKLEDTKKGG